MPSIRAARRSNSRRNWWLTEPSRLRNSARNATTSGVASRNIGMNHGERNAVTVSVMTTVQIEKSAVLNTSRVARPMFSTSRMTLVCNRPVLVCL